MNKKDQSGLRNVDRTIDNAAKNIDKVIQELDRMSIEKNLPTSKDILNKIKR
jgi:hypothetical protein